MKLTFASAGIAAAAITFGLLAGAGTAYADNDTNGDSQNARTAQAPQQNYSEPARGWQFSPRSNRTEYHSNLETPTGPYPDVNSTMGKVHS
ncbi:MAG: hypothetical protein U0R77_01495 [Mycolicibacterium insubricum]|nr:hypothetical protein [Mycobacterium sp.]